MAKPSDTLARLRARSTEAGRFVLPLDPAWADKAQDAYDALRRAEVYEGEERALRVAAAQASIDQIAAEAGDNVAVFRFRRLSRAQYDELVSRNPPSEEQRAEDQDKMPGQRRVFNLDTFGPDLLHAVLLDPRLELEEVAVMLNGADDEVLLSKGEAEALLAAAMSTALSVPRAMPKGLALP